jgi:hypothetical protein
MIRASTDGFCWNANKKAAIALVSLRTVSFEEVARMLAEGLLQMGTLIVGSVGIYVALVNQRRQLNAQMFIEFSGRFQELLRFVSD